VAKFWCWELVYMFCFRERNFSSSYTASSVSWSELLATELEVTGSIAGATTFSSIASGTGSTQQREDNCGVTWKRVEAPV
jgi:hypothetical protein